MALTLTGLEVSAMGRRALVVAYLCSDQGNWISGKLYNVDGASLAGEPI